MSPLVEYCRKTFDPPLLPLGLRAVSFPSIVAIDADTTIMPIESIFVHFVHKRVYCPNGLP